MELVNQGLSFFAYLFVFAAGLAVLAVIVLYLIDVTQTRHAVRRNYPVIGRFRYYYIDNLSFIRWLEDKWRRFWKDLRIANSVTRR